ncbi:hypothetical protein ACFQ1L_41835 [Phytohabitans flavus]
MTALGGRILCSEATSIGTVRSKSRVACASNSGPITSPIFAMAIACEIGSNRPVAGSMLAARLAISTELSGSTPSRSRQPGSAGRPPRSKSRQSRYVSAYEFTARLRSRTCWTMSPICPVARAASALAWRRLASWRMFSRSASRVATASGE